MKKIIILLSLLFLSCAGLQINENVTHRVLAFGSGKLMAIGVNKLINDGKLRKEVDSELTSAWVGLMEVNEGKPAVEPAEMVTFYNKCLYIIAGYDFDKYGLIGDLSELLMIYGAEINPDSKELVSIMPVPIEILKTFERGYASGRAITKEVK